MNILYKKYFDIEKEVLRVYKTGRLSTKKYPRIFGNNDIHLLLMILLKVKSKW